MSLAADDQTDGPLTEAPQEHEQKESEMCLKEDGSTNESDPNDPKNEDAEVKDHLKVDQRPRRTASPLTLLKEDFLNVFKEKEAKMKQEDRASTQRENKAASRKLDLLKVDLISNVFNKDRDTKSTDAKPIQLINPLTLLKEDFSQLKEDVSSIFNKDKDTKSTDPKTSQVINPLALLKEDISSVFRISLSKERDSKQDDTSTSTSTSTSDEPFKKLFRKDQSKVWKSFRRAEKAPEDKKTEGQTEDDFSGRLSEQNTRTVNAEKMNEQDESSELEEREEDVQDSETQEREETSEGKTF